MTTSATNGKVERLLLGVTAAALTVAGAVGMVTQEEPGWPGIVLRSGIILGAVWLAMPNLRRMRRRTWGAIALPALIVMFRPRLILWGLAAGVVAWLFTRGKR